MQNLTNKRRKGFTVIELIVVMAVLAILVLLAVPKLFNYTKEAQATQIKNDVKVVEGKLEEYLIRNNSNMPEDLEVMEKSEVESKVAEDLVHDVRGLVSSVAGDEFYKLKDTQRSKLKGDFIANEDGKVYYIHTKSIDSNHEDSSDESGCLVIPTGEMEPIDFPSTPIVVPEEMKEILGEIETLKDFLIAVENIYNSMGRRANMATYTDGFDVYIVETIDNEFDIEIIVATYHSYIDFNQGRHDDIDYDYFLHYTSFKDGDIKEVNGNIDLLPRYTQGYNQDKELIGCPVLTGTDDSGVEAFCYTFEGDEIVQTFSYEYQGDRDLDALLSSNGNLYVYDKDSYRESKFKKILDNVSNVHGVVNIGGNKNLFFERNGEIHRLHLAFYDWEENTIYNLGSGSIKKYNEATGILTEDGRLIDSGGGLIASNVVDIFQFSYNYGAYLTSSNEFYVKGGMAFYKEAVLPGVTSYAEISPGGDRSFYAIANGNLYAWGANNYGNLGTGDILKKNEPHAIQLSQGAEAIKFIGGYHSGSIFALDSNKNLWKWGGTYKEGSTPQIYMNNVDDILEGADKTLFILSNGDVVKLKVLNNEKEYTEIGRHAINADKIWHERILQSVVAESKIDNRYDFLYDGGSFTKEFSISGVVDKDISISGRNVIARKADGYYVYNKDDNIEYEFKLMEGQALINMDKVSIGMNISNIYVSPYGYCIQDIGEGNPVS